MTDQTAQSAVPLTTSQMICYNLAEFESVHLGTYTITSLSEDRDGETAHLIVKPTYNDSLALIGLIGLLAGLTLKLIGLHHLSGKYKGSIEVDVQFGKQPIPKFLGTYVPQTIEDNEIYPGELDDGTGTGF